MDNPSTFGQRLRAARQRKGLSMRQLSALTGINRSVLSTMENRDEPQESVRFLVRIAKALGVSIDELVRGEHDL